MTDTAENPSHQNLDTIREQAAFWVVERQSEDQDTQIEFKAWLEQNPLHQKIFGQMEQMWLAVDPAEHQQKVRTKRNRIASGLAFCLLGAALHQLLPWQYWRADYKTETGQIRSVTLADGSTAILNSNSAINIHFTDSGRTIELVRGEALFEVQKDQQQRRFIVSTPLATAEALGTAYSVGITDKHTLVSVYESEVKASATLHNSMARLKPGQQARIGADSLEQSRFNLTGAPDWSQGSLVFNRVPVQEVVTRLNQYHPGMLHLMDDQDKRLFTGVLPADDSAAAVKLFAQSMGFSLQEFTPYVSVLIAEEKN